MKTYTTNIFYVIVILFLVTLGKPIEFVMVQALPDERNSTIKNLDKVTNSYRSRGFETTQIDAGGQFESLEDYYAALINICSHKEYVPGMERKIRVSKERSRADMSGIPFSKIPRVMVIYLVHRHL